MGGRPKQKGTDCKVVIKHKAKDMAALQESVKEGQNNVMVSKNLEIFTLPDIDINNPDQVKVRITEYFSICAEHDSKPTLSALAMALGMDRMRLFEIRSGRRDGHNIAFDKINPESVELIRKTYDFLEMMWEDYMLNGKINPASGIFIGKNQFDYRDVVDQRVTADFSRTEIDAESIRKRYLSTTADQVPNDPD